jgi:site-specific DNA-cytosine methylase
MGKLRVLDLFSCIGCHAIGLERVGGFETVAFCESNPWRRERLAERYPGIPIHADVRTLSGVHADVVFGGPPCQKTSVAAAIHGKRTGESLWPDMLRLGVHAGAEWIVVEQPPGNAEWEAYVSDSLARTGRHVARFEFEARDVRAPYERRRVFLISCTSLSRLEVAWKAGPSAIERVARAADARGAWDPDQLEALPVDARSAGEFDRGARSRERQRWIEALGDSNPPGMAEVIGHMLACAA